MKTLIALLVALLGFSASLAWSAEPGRPTTRQPQNATAAAAAQPAASRSGERHAAPRRVNRTGTATEAARSGQAPGDASTVLCACVRPRLQA